MCYKNPLTHLKDQAYFPQSKPYVISILHLNVLFDQYDIP